MMIDYITKTCVFNVSYCKIKWLITAKTKFVEKQVNDTKT